MKQSYYEKFRMRCISMLCVISMLLFSGVVSSGTVGELPMHRVYQGKIHLPDFSDRDRQFSSFRTRIRDEMKTGPNFAGHYAIVEIGCGTSCRFVFVGDVATGKMFHFPYGGEENYSLDLKYGVKENSVEAHWVDMDKSECVYDSLIWDGKKFESSGPRSIGPREKCK